MQKMTGKFIGWDPYTFETMPPIEELFEMRFRCINYDPQVKGRILAILNTGKVKYLSGTTVHEMTLKEMLEAGMVEDKTGEPFGKRNDTIKILEGKIADLEKDIERIQMRLGGLPEFAVDSNPEFKIRHKLYRRQIQRDEQSVAVYQRFIKKLKEGCLIDDLLSDI